MSKILLEWVKRPTFFLKKLINYSEILNDFLKGTGFVLIDLKQKGENQINLLEVFVDKKENFGIDEIALLNKNLWKYLEENNIDKGISKIIVSSPGAENPFKFFWQMEKHLGWEVEFLTGNGEALSGKFEAIIDSEKKEFQILTKDKKNTKVLNFLFGSISGVKIKLSFKK